MIIRKSRLFALVGIILVISTFSQVKAQTIELSPFIGYETGGRVYTSKGYLKVGDGMNFGGALNFSIGQGRQIELSYNHMNTALSLDEGYNTWEICDIAVDYYSIGGLQELSPGGKAVPYALASIGWVNYRPSDSYGNENLMHLSFAGGVKVFATEHVGIRLQARILMPIWYGGFYFSGGTGGPGYGVSASAAAVQGDFTAALIFKFGDY